jgi:hypothetical protein
LDHGVFNSHGNCNTMASIMLRGVVEWRDMKKWL